MLAYGAVLLVIVFLIIKWIADKGNEKAGYY